MFHNLKQIDLRKGLADVAHLSSKLGAQPLAQRSSPPLLSGCAANRNSIVGASSRSARQRKPRAVVGHPMPMQLPPVGARSSSVVVFEPAMQRPPCPARVASLVNRTRELDCPPADEDDPGGSSSRCELPAAPRPEHAALPVGLPPSTPGQSSCSLGCCRRLPSAARALLAHVLTFAACLCRPSSAYSGAKGAVGSRPGSGSARPGSASSSVRSFFNGRTQPVPGPPAWWLGSGRESPATGLAGREAKHTAKYQAFAQRAELLLASIDESVQRSTVATHIQGRTQMIDVATFWDAWEGEIPPEGALPEWRPYSGPFLNAGRVHPNSLPLSFRIVIRNRTQRTVSAARPTTASPVQH